MMDLQKKRVQLLLFIAGIIVLSITAEKCRQLVGEEGSSQSGKFTILNCFDMGSGSTACIVKEGIKLYFYNIRSAHVERARHKAIGTALTDALSQGLDAQAASKQAQKEGAKAAKLASRQAKRIIGPIISSGWDFFEAIYYGGTVTEGFIRGTGTLFGAYGGGFLGEQRLGRFGYLVGSHLGSWVGGRIGLMVYDVVNGVHFLLQLTPSDDSTVDETPSEDSYQAWAYEHLPALRGIENKKYNLTHHLMLRWKPMGASKIDIGKLQILRGEIDNLNATQVIWDMYKSRKENEKVVGVVLYYGVLGCCEITKPYHSDRVLRQFALLQTISTDPIKPNIEDISLLAAFKMSGSLIWIKIGKIWKDETNQIQEGIHVTNPWDASSNYLDWYSKVTHPRMH